LCGYVFDFSGSYAAGRFQQLCCGSFAAASFLLCLFLFILYFFFFKRKELRKETLGQILWATRWI